MMKVQAVIFDLFGTLVDDFAVSSVGKQEEFSAALGVPHDAFMPSWRQIADRRAMGEFQTVEASIEHVCKLIGAAVSPEQMTKAVQSRLQLTRQVLRPRADAIETLTKLRNDGFKIGLLSNCSIEIPIVWPETPLACLMDAAVFSSRERLKKPDPRIYQLACERLNVTPALCLYLADGENHELAAAAKVGLRAVLLRNSQRDNGSELLREAREWQGDAVCTLSEVFTLTTR